MLHFGDIVSHCQGTIVSSIFYKVICSPTGRGWDVHESVIFFSRTLYRGAGIDAFKEWAFFFILFFLPFIFWFWIVSLLLLKDIKNFWHWKETFYLCVCLSVCLCVCSNTPLALVCLRHHKRRKDSFFSFSHSKKLDKHLWGWMRCRQRPKTTFRSLWLKLKKKIMMMIMIIILLLAAGRTRAIISFFFRGEDWKLRSLPEISFHAFLCYLRRSPTNNCSCTCLYSWNGIGTYGLNSMKSLI